MIQAHADLYRRLTARETYLLWHHLWKSELLTDKPDPARARGEELGAMCSHLSHAEVIISLASRTEKLWCDIVDKLLEKPVYMCARGETGMPETDLLGRPLPMPVGHRRGEPLGTGGMPRPVVNRIQRVRKHDPRIITFVVSDNPKQPGSKAYARFMLYRVGMSVAQFLVLGGQPADISNDVQCGHIRVDLP